MDTQQLSRDLGSIETPVRQKALAALPAHLQTVPRTSYKRIAYGLFFFYYHSDGLTNQANDAEAICGLFTSLSRASFVFFARTMFEVFKRLWHRIDYHRLNKYLGLVKDVLRAVYKRIRAEKSQLLFDYWNKYLCAKLFGDDKGELSSAGPVLRVPVHRGRAVRRCGLQRDVEPAAAVRARV